MQVYRDNYSGVHEDHEIRQASLFVDIVNLILGLHKMD